MVAKAPPVKVRGRRAMARSLSKISIIGNLGSDPELRYLPSGDAVTSFSVAVNRRFRTRDGEMQEETDWFRVSAWRQLAEITNQYLTKGQLVFVEGRFSSRKWTTPDGEERTSLDVSANEVVFMNSNAGDGSSSYRDSAMAPGGMESQLEPDDLPF